MKLRMARNVVILGLRTIRVGKATNGLTSARIRAVTNLTIGVGKATNCLAGTRHRVIPNLAIGVSKATNFLAGTRHRVNVPAADGRETGRVVRLVNVPAADGRETGRVVRLVNVPATDVIIDGVLLHGNLARGIGRRRVHRRPEYFRIISGRCMRRKARD